MKSTDPVVTPSGHTPEGESWLATPMRNRSWVFEDPQCSYCRHIEELNGPLTTAALEAGELAVEYRMRCFLGRESLRADNALALALVALTNSAKRSLPHGY